MEGVPHVPGNKLETAATRVIAQDDPSQGKSDWKAQAKELADRIYKRYREMNCDPSFTEIAKDIEKEFAGKVFSGKNKVLRFDYIKRHGLEGWKRPET